MDAPFLCPICRENRTDFMQVYKLAREMRKNADTGALEYVSDEWETVARGGGPDLDVKCRLCGYVGSEREFTRAAKHDAERLPRPGFRRA